MEKNAWNHHSLVTLKRNPLILGSRHARRATSSTNSSAKHPLKKQRWSLPYRWWKRSGVHQLRLVVYPIIYKVYISQVANRISSINSRSHRIRVGLVSFGMFLFSVTVANEGLQASPNLQELYNPSGDSWEMLGRGSHPQVFYLHEWLISYG